MSNEIKRYDSGLGMEERVDGQYVLHSDHEAEVARRRAEDSYQRMLLDQAKRTILDLRAEVEAGEKNLAAAMDQLAESDAEIDKLEAIANAARQVAAWFTSGNSVPVSGTYQMTVNNHSIMADVHVLNEALSAMGDGA